MATRTADVSAQASPIKLPRLPVRELGFENVPAVPVDVPGMVNTLFRLGIRLKQREQALQGLSKTFTIGGSTARAYDFLFGHEAPDAKEAAEHERLRGLLNRNTLELLPAIVESIKAQDAQTLRPGSADRLTRRSLDDPRRQDATTASAAMVMTMFENLSPHNPVHKLLEPHSNYLIPFDDLLLLGWSSLPGVPPTSLATAAQFLELIDRYADGRGFFDDDPTTTLERLGLTEADFTVDEPWDRYPIAGDLLEIWDATGRYVDTYVEHAYASDADVARDQEVQRWIAASGGSDDGTVSGLPAMASKDALKRVLHSLLYRITAHGGSRLYRSANPALTFVANFPPCLQNATIPDPDADFDTRTLHRFLPNTGSVGSMVYFYFTFWASPPYVPFVPIGGAQAELFFDDAPSNEALVELRRFIAGFIERVEPDTPQIWQWERNIEL